MPVPPFTLHLTTQTIGARFGSECGAPRNLQHLPIRSTLVPIKCCLALSRQKISTTDERNDAWATIKGLRGHASLQPCMIFCCIPFPHLIHPLPHLQLIMETIHRPHRKSLFHRGIIQGVTISTPIDNSGKTTDLCHYFGGVRYVLPPTQRWRRARPLPSTYSYGTQDRPGKCESGAGLCPQSGSMTISPANEDAWTEDCFQCNVWVPTGEAPKGGWPVFFFIREYLDPVELRRLNSR